MTEKVSEDMLMALADGELDAETTRRLQAQLQADPALRARYAPYQRSAEAVRALFADALDAEPPERLVAALRAAPVAAPTPPPAATVTSLDAARRRRWGSGWGALPLAATLALAAGLGFLLGRGNDAPPAPGTGLDRLHAAAEALADAPSGEVRELADGSRAAILASFDTATGACRRIQLRTPEGSVWESLGCHDGTGWRIALVLPQEAGSGYAPAEGATAGALDAYLAGLDASAPLAPDTEAARIDRGWTRD